MRFRFVTITTSLKGADDMSENRKDKQIKLLNEQLELAYTENQRSLDKCQAEKDKEISDLRTIIDTQIKLERGLRKKINECEAINQKEIFPLFNLMQVCDDVLLKTKADSGLGRLAIIVVETLREYLLPQPPVGKEKRDENRD